MSSTNRGGKRIDLDAYYTPGDLAQVLVGVLPIGEWDAVLEPSVGGGAFVRALRSMRHRGRVIGCDLNPDVPGLTDCDDGIEGDFLDVRSPDDVSGIDWIIGNPPFQQAEAHIRHALAMASNVAMLLRLAFLETSGRVPFWREHPATRIWVLAQRPSFTGGATDSCAYGWFWWGRHSAGATTLDVLSWR